MFCIQVTQLKAEQDFFLVLYRLLTANDEFFRFTTTDAAIKTGGFNIIFCTV